MPAAVEVARTLDRPLDVLLLAALVALPSGQLLRAASVAGNVVVDDGSSAFPGGSIEHAVVDNGVRALTARSTACRGSRPAVAVNGREVLLIDNGMRTGRTMAAAISAVRTLGPGRVVVGIPAATPAAFALIGDLADDCSCLITSASLGNVAMAYRTFDVPDEARIREWCDGRLTAPGRAGRCATSDAMDLAALTYETAKALEGTPFRIELPDGTVVPMTLDEVLPYESRQRRPARGVSPRRAPFSIYFLGPVQPVLPQATYTLRGDEKTFDKLFIVPIGQDGEATEYEAVFT